MLSSNFIDIKEVFLDYTDRRNLFSKAECNYVIVFNKLKIELNIKVNDAEFLSLSSEGTKIIPFSDFYLNLKIFDTNLIELIETLEIPFFKWKINGIGENSFIETKQGKTKISNLNAKHSIYNPNLNYENYLTKIKFKIPKCFEKNIESKNSMQSIGSIPYPIKIKKNSCGINIPYEDTNISINNSVKIKKIIIKGRQLFLNRKAIKSNESEYLYNLITKNNNHYLSNGFIFDSYLPY